MICSYRKGRVEKRLPAWRLGSRTEDKARNSKRGQMKCEKSGKRGGASFLSEEPQQERLPHERKGAKGRHPNF